MSAQDESDVIGIGLAVDQETALSFQALTGFIALVGAFPRDALERLNVAMPQALAGIDHIDDAPPEMIETVRNKLLLMSNMLKLLNRGVKMFDLYQKAAEIDRNLAEAAAQSYDDDSYTPTGAA